MKKALLAAMIFTCGTAMAQTPAAQGVIHEDREGMPLAVALQKLVEDAPVRFSDYRDENSKQAMADNEATYKGILQVRNALPGHDVTISKTYASYEMFVAKGIPMKAAADKSQGLIALAQTIMGEDAKVVTVGNDIEGGRSRHLTRISRGKGPYILITRYDSVQGASDLSVRVVN